MTIQRVEDHGHGGCEQPVEPSQTITVNGRVIPIHVGSLTVAAIKKIGGIAQADDLEQVVAGRLVPLPDDGCVTLGGGEVFVSHPKDSKSS